MLSGLGGGGGIVTHETFVRKAFFIRSDCSTWNLYIKYWFMVLCVLNSTTTTFDWCPAGRNWPVQNWLWKPLNGLQGAKYSSAYFSAKTSGGGGRVRKNVRNFRVFRYLAFLDWLLSLDCDWTNLDKCSTRSRAGTFL